MTTLRTGPRPLLRLAVAAAGVALLGFVAGSLATLADAYPGRLVGDAYRAGRALQAQLSLRDQPFQPDLWRLARSGAAGVTVNKPGKVQPGLTLYTSGHAQAAFLLDQQGREVHRWSLPFSAVWDRTAAVKKPQPDGLVYVEKALLYPNGDLLAVYVAVGDTPWGYGLVKMDQDSRVLWKYLAHAHHDVDVGADGTIYVLTNEVARDDLPGFPQLRAPRIQEQVAVLSPEGDERKRVDLFAALLRSPYARLLDTLPWYTMLGSGDFLHTNAVNVLDGTRAQKLPEATAGRLLLSFREISTVAILDMETEEIVWAMRGPWLRQHDPDLLVNGDVLLFDNQGNVGGAGGVTRLLEVDPRTGRVAWTYAGGARERFESEVRSSQERLANGNTLVTESDGGRLFEVARDGEIVWEWVNPVRGGVQDELIPIVAWGQRIDPAALEEPFRRRLLAGPVVANDAGPAARISVP